MSNPTRVIGDGTPASCTSAAVAAAVRSGGVITFSCGPKPITIVLNETLHTCNTTTCRHPWISGTPVSKLVVDGGGLVTLSGGGKRGIFYANACEESFGWLSDHCQDDSRPYVVFQNIGFVNGNATTGPAGLDDLRGGGAIAMRSGHLKVVNATFWNNRCMVKDSDGGGGAIRITGMSQPSYIVTSSFAANRCANGGAISSLQATVHVIGSTISGNVATGSGASSGQGGNGGGIYFDGTSDDVVVDGSLIQGNKAPEGGPGIFYVSNDRTGNLVIEGSRIVDNSGESFFTAPYRDIFYLGKGPIQITGSTVE